MAKTSQKSDTLVEVIPAPINRVYDCPTFQVDGLNGMAANPHIVKISFVEHFMEAEGLVARHVVNLAIDREQFLKVVHSLNSMAAAMAPKAEGQE